MRYRQKLNLPGHALPLYRESLGHTHSHAEHFQTRRIDFPESLVLRVKAVEHGQGQMRALGSAVEWRQTSRPRLTAGRRHDVGTKTGVCSRIPRASQGGTKDPSKLDQAQHTWRRGYCSLAGETLRCIWGNLSRRVIYPASILAQKGTSLIEARRGKNIPPRQDLFRVIAKEKRGQRKVYSRTTFAVGACGTHMPTVDRACAPAQPQVRW